MRFLGGITAALRSSFGTVVGAIALAIGFVSIVFFSPTRNFHVGIGDYPNASPEDGPGVAHADAPSCASCQSGDSCGISCDGSCSCGGEGGGEGCGGGEGGCGGGGEGK